jgi:hypothetical protein
MLLAVGINLARISKFRMGSTQHGVSYIPNLILVGKETDCIMARWNMHRHAIHVKYINKQSFQVDGESVDVSGDNSN